MTRGVFPNTSQWLSTGSVRNLDLSRAFEMTAETL